MSHQITGNHSPHSTKTSRAASTFDNLPDSGFMRQPQVLAVVPFSSATLWRKCKAGQFPKPVKLSERVTAWRAGDVRLFLKTKTEALA